MNTQKICCFTGHRQIAEDQWDNLRAQLCSEVQKAVDDGYTTFISGFAQGADLLFAEVVLDLKKNYPHLFLEAAIPYANRLRSPDKRFQSLLSQCDGHKVIRARYQPDCFLLRNRYMVRQAHRVIAAYDGRERGGTVSTMRYAHCLDREVRVILVKTK